MVHVISYTALQGPLLRKQVCLASPESMAWISNHTQIETMVNVMLSTSVFTKLSLKFGHG